jgi:hypothetical protein
MRTVTHRLCRLEATFAPPDDPEGRRLVALLYMRQRYWAEVNSETYVRPEPYKPDSRTIVEILRARFNGPPAK